MPRKGNEDLSHPRGVLSDEGSRLGSACVRREDEILRLRAQNDTGERAQNDPGWAKRRNTTTTRARPWSRGRSSDQSRMEWSGVMERNG
jgi:hypothetical protein